MIAELKSPYSYNRYLLKCADSACLLLMASYGRIAFKTLSGFQKVGTKTINKQEYVLMSLKFSITLIQGFVF